MSDVGDGLLVESGHDLLDEPVTHARCVDGGDREQLAAASLAQSDRTAAARQQLQDCLVVDLGAENSFQSGMDLCQRATDPVRHASGFAGEIVVEPDQDLQFGQSFVAGVDPAQRVRKSAGRVGDDEGVAGVGLRVAGVQIGDPPHRQAGQVGHPMATRPSHRDRQGADRGRLVNHHQDPTMTGQFVEQLPQPALSIRQRRVVQPLAVRSQTDRVVITLTNVQAQEDAISVVHRTRLHASHRGPRPQSGRRTAGSHVTKRPTPTQVAVSLSAVRRRHPTRRQHPPDHRNDRGRKSYRAGRPRSPRLGTIKKVTGHSAMVWTRDRARICCGVT